MLRVNLFPGIVYSFVRTSDPAEEVPSYLTFFDNSNADIILGIKFDVHNRILSCNYCLDGHWGQELSANLTEAYEDDVINLHFNDNIATIELPKHKLTPSIQISSSYASIKYFEIIGLKEQVNLISTRGLLDSDKDALFPTIEYSLLSARISALENSLENKRLFVSAERDLFQNFS
jgi:hypothetical protein